MEKHVTYFYPGTTYLNDARTATGMDGTLHTDL